MTKNWFKSPAVGLMTCVVLLSACDGRRETREVLNMPDMHFQPAIKAQEPNPWSPTGTMMMPVEGTVPADWEPYTITNDQADDLAMKLENPLPMTEEVLKTGKRYYEIYCVVCHGDDGKGLGPVIRANAGMPPPPTFHSDKLRDEWTDGRIFHVITRGQGNMPAYTRIDPNQRWAIIHYVRALQRAHNPSEQDIADVEQFKQEHPELVEEEKE